MQPPKIYETDYENILRELAASYIPEWSAQDDAGSALLTIFSNMVNQVTTRLNRVPNKNFIAFLNMIDTKLLPAQPARVPVTFFLAEGALESVLVPAKTLVATSETEEHPSITFETEKTMGAQVVQLKALYSVNPSMDQVIEHASELFQGKAVELFTSSVPKMRILYFAHDSLFNLGKSVGEGNYTNIILDLESIDESLDSVLPLIVWEYWGEGQDGKDQWIRLVAGNSESTEPNTKKSIVLKKTNTYPAKKKKIEENESFWIRAKIEDTLPSKTPTLKPVKAQIQNLVEPDTAFYNDTSLDLTNSFFPFGTQPNTYDTFYIGSQEGFSKKNAEVTISFEISQRGTPNQTTGGALLLSWEYWNGKAWDVIRGISFTKYSKRISAFLGTFTTTKSISIAGTYEFDTNADAKFSCPPDIEPLELNGKKNHWIRIRIVSGNYGIKTTDNATPSPPKIEKIKILNSCAPQPLQHCLTNNNLQFIDCSKAELFKPFQPLEEKRQTIYFGFDKPFSTDRISIFFSLQKQEYLEETKPRIEWSYLGLRSEKAEWIPMNVLDDTDNLTRSGTIEFIGPNEIAKVKKFGHELYWIRAEIVEGEFQSFEETKYIVIKEKLVEAKLENLSTMQILRRCGMNSLVSSLTKDLSYMRRLSMTNFAHTANSEFQAPAQSSETEHELTNVVESLPLISTGPCLQEAFLHPKFTFPREIIGIPASPKISGIYLNTTWAIQAETVSEEVLGTGDGTAEQSFSFSRNPVLSENIMVREPAVPATYPDKNAQEYLVQVTNTGEIWVTWQAAEDFLDSDEESRHYIIDRTSGQIRFGDGKNGMAPQAGAVIKATYQTGGGVMGNVRAGEIRNLLTSIAFVDSVINPESAQGAADTETEENVLEKSPKRIQHRWRAVTKEDYEWLAKEASRAVARAKCIPNLNDEGEKQPGCVSVIIVPESREDLPIPSSELVRIVEDYIKNRNPVSVSKLTVTYPAYLSISVTAELYVPSIDLASSVKFAAIERLKEFLHPLFGGYDGKGWEFGKIPCLSAILTLLEDLPNVEHVENASMTVKEEGSGVTLVVTDLKQGISLPPYMLISSGTHQIAVRWEG
jgi:uncharacterized phage protein gp47/JayE